MSTRRRIILIFVSVTFGSLISLYFVRKRMGTLKPEDYMQLGINFAFAVAIVLGVALLLNHMNKKQQDGKK